MKSNWLSVGILLAGGLSRRYGSPKAFAQYNGKYFYEIAYEALATVCQHVIIVTRQELIERFPKDVHIIMDNPLFVGNGPLAGIYSVMEDTNANQYVVLPCDMPLMTAQVLEQLIEQHEHNVSIAVYKETIQPLVSVWSKEVKADIYIALKNGQLKMKEFLSKVPTKQVAMDPLNIGSEVFMNVNTPENKKELGKWTQL